MKKTYLSPFIKVIPIKARSPLCDSNLSGKVDYSSGGNSAGDDISDDDIISGGSF